MKTELRRKGQKIKLSVITFYLLLIVSFQLFAQNVSDSDLSNSAGTNKNWYGSMWFFVVLAALVIVVLIAFNRRRNRNRNNILQHQQKH
jgi:hypothetical protein